MSTMPGLRARRVRRGGIALGVLLLTSVSASASIRWTRAMGGVGVCEPPHLFYSRSHQPGTPPCCPSAAGVCPGGDACPPSGVCAGPERVRCVPPPEGARPNVVLMISDDQGACHYGSARECRSVESGIAVPAPETPNLDVLASRGTVFPVAHNTASWCFPSLASILTGRYQRSFNGTSRRIAEVFVTIPSALRALGNAPGTVVDSFDPEARIGGYCTLQGGKFVSSTGRPKFDARPAISERRLGRIPCRSTGNGRPGCGTDGAPGYAPFDVRNMGDLFEFVDALQYRKPGATTEYALQPFFAWYAPRVPHQPLRAPAVIETYLFGPKPGRSGIFDLGGLCAGGSCAPEVAAFAESNFGTVQDFYASVFWMDANVGEIRRFLEHMRAPHCIGSTGRSRFGAGAGQCAGTWATIAPDPVRNTILLYLADNGWHLPDSKHHFTENGYRTRLVVFDPRPLAEVPGASPEAAAHGDAFESSALAHSTDVLPTVLGFALDAPGSQPCPASADGTRCDGKDLRPHLRTAPGGPAEPGALRHAMCGHFTQRATAPTRWRYLLTGPGSVGRCVPRAARACATDAECPAGAACVAGRCTGTAEPACLSSVQCPTGAACLGGRCRVAPACTGDDDCRALFPNADYLCAAKSAKWCRNDPSRACSGHDDCPACPTVNGRPTSCGRLCEPRMLKLYERPGRPAELTDLFLDPDEVGLHDPSKGALVTDLSRPDGPYAATVRKLACCLRDWWPEGADGGLCGRGDACPADFACD